MLWGQMYVIGCLEKGQHGSGSARWPIKRLPFHNPKSTIPTAMHLYQEITFFWSLEDLRKTNCFV